jgi:phosphatidate cytidylyltransferase
MTSLRAGIGRVAARARRGRRTAGRERSRGSAGPARPRTGASSAGRWLVGIPWAVVAVFVVVHGGTLLAILLIALGIVALHELYGMLDAVRPVRLAGFAGMAGLVVAAQYGGDYQIVMAAAGTVVLTFALAMIGDTRRHTTLAIGATLLGVFWVGLALAHASLLRQLDHGDGLLIDVLLATFVGDTAAYFGGRLYGTTSLAPSISPGKTVEGLICGILFGTLGFWAAGWYQDWLSGVDALAIGACVAVAAPFGDLFESMIKRDLGVKDSGRFFGQHGGVLDRLDAAFITVIVGYYAASAIL